MNIWDILILLVILGAACAGLFLRRKKGASCHTSACCSCGRNDCPYRGSAE